MQKHGFNVVLQYCVLEGVLFLSVTGKRGPFKAAKGITIRLLSKLKAYNGFFSDVRFLHLWPFSSSCPFQMWYAKEEPKTGMIVTRIRFDKFAANGDERKYSKNRSFILHLFQKGRCRHSVLDAVSGCLNLSPVLTHFSNPAAAGMLLIPFQIPTPSNIN